MPVNLSFVIRKASNIVSMQMDRGVTNSQVRSGLRPALCVSKSIFSCEASVNVNFLHAKEL